MKLRLYMKKILTGGVLGLLSVALVAPVLAGQFSVTPVRIFVAPKDRAAAVTVTNEGNDPLVMQADVYVWNQKPDGEDELTPSEDLFLSPPILKLAPNSRQVVRLAMLHPPKAGRQLTYRMIVREIPEARDEEVCRTADRAGVLVANFHYTTGGQARARLYGRAGRCQYGAGRVPEHGHGLCSAARLHARRYRRRQACQPE